MLVLGPEAHEPVPDDHAEEDALVRLADSRVLDKIPRELRAAGHADAGLSGLTVCMWVAGAAMRRVRRRGRAPRSTRESDEQPEMPAVSCEVQTISQTRLEQSRQQRAPAGRPSRPTEVLPSGH